MAALPVRVGPLPGGFTGGEQNTNAAVIAETFESAGACEIVDHLPTDLARYAAMLRRKARRGSTIDALVVATADPGGAVLTGDPKDLIAIADHAHEVTVHVV